MTPEGRRFKGKPITPQSNIKRFSHLKQPTEEKITQKLNLPKGATNFDETLPTAFGKGWRKERPSIQGAEK
ncbi:hypothetical protein JCM16307_18230 [Thermococcus prieurii]